MSDNKKKEERSEESKPRPLGSRGGRGKGGKFLKKKPAALSAELRQEDTDMKEEVKKPPVESAKADLKPKSLSKQPSAQRNDPLINDIFEIDGVKGYVEVQRTREFQVDFTQYVELVESSYRAAVTADRGLAKYISLSMYQYYCTTLLWKRLYLLESKHGRQVVESTTLDNALSFELPVPSDVILYLTGLGDLKDPSSREFQFTLQAELTELATHGAHGSFGRVSAATHLSYETLPAPIVSLLKIQADIAQPIVEEWNLPEALRPEDQNAVAPTISLLGWGRARTPTVEQRAAIEDAGFTANNFGTRNIGNFPLNLDLIKYVGAALKASKVPAIGVMPSSTMGSQAQVGFMERAPDDVEPDNRRISAKSMVGCSYTQTVSQVGCAAVTFRYRVKRTLNADTIDGICYSFRANPPAAWIANQNVVFNHGVAEGIWNLRQFRIAPTNGDTLATTLSQRVRAKVTKQ